MKQWDRNSVTSDHVEAAYIYIDIYITTGNRENTKIGLNMTVKQP